MRRGHGLTSLQADSICREKARMVTSPHFTFARGWVTLPAMGPHDTITITTTQTGQGRSPPSDMALRVKVARIALMVEKGLVDPAALDAIVDHFEHRVGPRNGARVVARALERSRLQGPAE